MKVNRPGFKMTWVALSVAQMIACTVAIADEDEAQALKMPQNMVQAGVINSSAASNKFGEYNGLSKGGSFLNLNINAKGGAGYSDNENGETRRWSFEGDNLGLSSRSLAARVSDQGEWSLGFKYDELEHVLTQGYQTPYQGTMGGNRWTSPGSLPQISLTNSSVFGTAGGATPPGYPTISGNFTPVSGAASPWSNYLSDMTVSSTRKNSIVSASYILNGMSSVEFEFNQLQQSGAKLIALASSNATSLINNATTTVLSGQKIAYLPNPTNYQTSNWNLGYHWKDDKSRLSLSYFGSFFKDGFDAVYFQPNFVTNASISGLTQAISTAPTNMFNQLNVSGGYDFSKTLKLTSNFSWGQGIQNAGFNSDTYTSTYTGGSGSSSLNNGTANLPGSLNGKVNNTHLDLKLVNLYSKDLTLAGLIRYDERDNLTPSTFYKFSSISSASYNYPNAPFSNRKTLVELSGDYKLNAEQKLRLSLGHEDMQRWCGNYASSSGVLAGASGYYPSGTSCVVATGSREDKVEASLKQKIGADTDLKFAYAYNNKQTTTNPYAITDMIGTNGNIPAGSATVPSGAILGLNAGDFIGFNPYFSASKVQNILKVSGTSQLDDRWAISAGGKMSWDRYGDSTYGVQMGMTHSLSADISYAYSENGSMFGFATQQYNRIDALSATTATTASSTSVKVPVSWFNTMRGSDLTVGAGFKDESLMHGRLTLKGDVNYSWARTSYFTQLYYTPITTAACSRSDVMTCGSLPDIQYTMSQLKLNGIYSIDKESKINMTLMYQHLRAEDYYYNGLQVGYSPTSLVPNNLNAGGYNIFVLGVSYVQNF